MKTPEKQPQEHNEDGRVNLEEPVEEDGIHRAKLREISDAVSLYHDPETSRAARGILKRAIDTANEEATRRGEEATQAEVEKIAEDPVIKKLLTTLPKESTPAASEWQQSLVEKFKYSPDDFRYYIQWLKDEIQLRSANTQGVQVMQGRFQSILATARAVEDAARTRALSPHNVATLRARLVSDAATYAREAFGAGAGEFDEAAFQRWFATRRIGPAGSAAA